MPFHGGVGREVSTKVIVVVVTGTGLAASATVAVAAVPLSVVDSRKPHAIAASNTVRRITPIGASLPICHRPTRRLPGLVAQVAVTRSPRAPGKEHENSEIWSFVDSVRHGRSPVRVDRCTQQTVRDAGRNVCFDEYPWLRVDWRVRSSAQIGSRPRQSAEGSLPKWWSAREHEGLGWHRFNASETGANGRLLRANA